MPHHPPELVIIYPGDLRDLVNRHLPYQGHGKGFEKECEVSSFPSPWQIYLKNSIIRTVNTWYSDYHVAGILEEVKMPEPFLRGIVSLNLFAALWAPENTTFREIDEDINRTFILIKFNLRNLPGRLQL